MHQQRLLLNSSFWLLASGAPGCPFPFEIPRRIERHNDSPMSGETADGESAAKLDHHRALSSSEHCTEPLDGNPRGESNPSPRKIRLFSNALDIPFEGRRRGRDSYQS